MKITHQHRFSINENHVFNDVSSYDELDVAIKQYGISQNSNTTSEEYRRAVGAAFEVFNQFFCLKYGSTPLLNINKITDTSLDPFNEGYDFSFSSLDENSGMLQTKWKSDSHHKFTRKELGTFSSVLRDEGITPNNSILFTNIRHAPSKDKGSLFHFGWDSKAQKQMRVVDRTAQEEFILRDSSFWVELNVVLAESCITQLTPVPVNEEHQDEMELASNRVIDGEISRGRIVCATGGGKTLIEYRNIIRTLFHYNKKLTVIVAPTRDLVDQHFTTFHDYGLFHEGVMAINFKSGSEPARDESRMSFSQTTQESDLIPILNDFDKVHICVTYKSLPVLINALNNIGYRADLIMFDEFQHLVSQKINEMGISNMREFLLELPADRILFYSASQKRGRILSSFDEDVFGPLLCDISYKRLRENGILVQKLNIIPVRVNPSRIVGLTESIKAQAKLFNNVDLKETTIEAAGMIVAYEHAKQNNPGVNMITWGKKISHLQTIGSSQAIRDRLSDDTIHVIHAGIPTRTRTEVYEKIRNSHNNILLQHSCVSEGVNVVNLDTAFVARRLNTISMQQGPGGRPTRAHPDDRARFKTGELKANNPDGWKKYTATVYVLVETGEDETFLSFMTDLVRKLQFAGLTEDDYEFLDLVEERHGTEEGDDHWKSNIELVSEIGADSLEDVIRQAHLDLEEEEADLEKLKDQNDIMNMSEDEFWNDLLGE